jgi:hypothetical protein
MITILKIMPSLPTSVNNILEQSCIDSTKPLKQILKERTSDNYFPPNTLMYIMRSEAFTLAKGIKILLGYQPCQLVTNSDDRHRDGP